MHNLAHLAAWGTSSFVLRLFILGLVGGVHVLKVLGTGERAPLLRSQKKQRRKKETNVFSEFTFWKPDAVVSCLIL